MAAVVVRSCVDDSLFSVERRTANPGLPGVTGLVCWSISGEDVKPGAVMIDAGYNPGNVGDAWISPLPEPVSA